MDLASTERYVHADTAVVRANMDHAITTSFEVVDDGNNTVTLKAEDWLRVVALLPDQELADLIANQL